MKNERRNSDERHIKVRLGDFQGRLKGWLKSRSERREVSIKRDVFERKNSQR